MASQLATVLRVDRKRVLVDTDEGESFEAQMRGNVAKGAGRFTSAIAVGDRVTVERAADGSAVIESIEPRRSVLYRPEVSGRWRRQVLVANADRAVLVFACRDPDPAAGLVDRLLVACHGGSVPPLLVFNKADLAGEDATRGLPALYQRLGYDVVVTSAATGLGTERLAQAVAGRCSVFAGPSGAGKSSLINRVLPGVHLRTGEISASSGKGKHTTTAAQLVRLAAGGHVIDTPGVKEFGLAGIAPTELDLSFPEFPGPQQCRFDDCRHRTEPGCLVRAAVERGEIERGRYESYLTLRSELEAEALQSLESGGARRP